MPQTTAVTTNPRRLAVYWLTVIGLLAVHFVVRGSEWRGSVQLHTIMEVAATLLAAVVGAMALVRFYSKPDNTFLFIGTGFLGTAFLDAHHGVVTSEFFQPFMPSDLPSLAPWSWVASRQFLSIMMFLAFLAFLREQRMGPSGRIAERTVYVFAALFTLASFAFFAFVPLPRAYFPEIQFSRPEEFAPALFFGLALAGFVKKGRWQHDVFEHWLVLSLVVGVVTQVVFMSQSSVLFDAQFDAAHLLKKTAYICVLTGLMISMRSLFRQAEESDSRFRNAIASMQEGFALYDASDRLVIFNDEYLRLHAGLGDVIKVGVKFEDMIRAQVMRGYVATAIGREEDHIQERMKQHRNPIGPILRELSDGTYYLINEARTIEGGIAVTETDITELKHAEKALRESEDRMRAVIDATPTMISLKDLEFRYILINKAHREFWGLDDDILGRTPESISTKYAAQIRELEKQVVETGEVTPIYYFPMSNANKEVRDLMVTKAPIRDLAGNVVGTVTASLDVTEQRRAERELEASATLTRKIMEASPVGALIVTRDGEHLFANEQALKIQGVTRDELFAENAGAYYADPTLREKLKNHLYETGNTPSTEVELIKPDGSHIVVNLSSTLTEFEGRQAHLTYMYDITELKRAEDAVRQSEERNRTIVDNIIDGIVTIDEKGTIISVNRATESIFGHDEGKLVGQNVRILAPEPYRGSHDQYLAAYRESGVARILGTTREIEAIRRNGVLFPAEITVSEIFLQGKRCFIGIIRDITYRREMDRMKGEFVSTVSHELRTPLTSIRGSLGLITAGAVGKLPEKAHELVVLAEKNTERLIRLVNDILDMEKLGSGRMEFDFKSVDLVDIVRNAITVNQGYADEYEISFRLTDPVAGFQVHADADRLSQVLANLLSNAAKFSPRGDAVEIAVTTRDGMARVSVSDNGPGIAEEFHENLFSRFTQADSSDTRQAGGTGLGLNISKTIIEKHGGRIDFDTEVGVGSTFFFELPILAFSGVFDADDIGEEADGEHRVRFLVCEDDPDIAGLLSMMLQGHGYATDIALTAGEARRLLAKNHYDAMTLDILLPDEDGVAFLRALRTQDATRDLPVIIVSVVAEERRIEFANGDAVGIVDFLRKPIDPDRLRNAVRNAVSDDTAGLPLVLHVEDDPDVVNVVRELMRGVARVESVSRLGDAKALLKKQDFDLVLVDVGLPDGSGLDLLGVLASEDGPSTPVIIFSGDEVTPETAKSVTAALIKSKTSNDQLLDVIRATIPQAEPADK